MQIRKKFYCLCLKKNLNIDNFATVKEELARKKRVMKTGRIKYIDFFKGIGIIL